MDPRRSTFFGCALVIGLTACGDSSTEPVGESPATPQRVILAAPSFATNINEIFQRRGCSSGSCHGNGTGGMTLGTSAPSNYAAIVGVQASSEDFLRIAPGDAENSYIMIKVEGRQTEGQRMPRGAAPLDSIDLTNLRNWITNGAPNN
jgi:hypothetical protein